MRPISYFAGISVISGVTLYASLPSIEEAALSTSPLNQAVERQYALKERDSSEELRELLALNFSRDGDRKSLPYETQNTITRKIRYSLTHRPIKQPA